MTLSNVEDERQEGQRVPVSKKKKGASMFLSEFQHVLHCHIAPILHHSKVIHSNYFPGISRLLDNWSEKKSTQIRLLWEDRHCRVEGRGRRTTKETEIKKIPRDAKRIRKVGGETVPRRERFIGLQRDPEK